MGLFKLITKPFLWAHHNQSLNRFFRILDCVIAAINKNVAVIGIVLGVLITAINVILRYVSSFIPEVSSLTWGEEMARYCFLWSAFFGAAYGFRKGVHISVMMLIERFSPRVAKACVISSHIISATFLGFMLYSSINVVLLNYDLGYMSEAFHEVPLFVFLLCLPISFLGATYRSVEKIYEVAWTPASEVIKNTQAEIIHDNVKKD